MANIKSQIKRNKQNEKRHERNKSVKSGLKTAVRKFREAAEAGDKDAAVVLRPRRLQEARQGRLQGCHPQEPGREPQVGDRQEDRHPLTRSVAAPHPRGRRRSLSSAGLAQVGDREHQPLQGVGRVAGRALDVGVGPGDRA